MAAFGEIGRLPTLVSYLYSPRNSRPVQRFERRHFNLGQAGGPRACLRLESVSTVCIRVDYQHANLPTLCNIQAARSGQAEIRICPADHFRHPRIPRREVVSIA